MKFRIRNAPQLFFFALPLLFSLTALATETRALKLIAVDTITKQSGEVTLYNRSVAVIIGIDQYANLPADKQLSYAVKDARGVADVLKRQYKFDQIITLYDKAATRKAIIKLLAVDLPKQLGEQDALFVFWAGHGNQESTREGDIGYLIPHDGNTDDITSNITMSEIRDTISKKIPAKHIFYVMDACYSGLLTQTRSIDKAPRRDLAYLQDITKERVRQVLTAGGKNEEVLDGGPNGHSVFTGRLIELLEKAGDFITANEIQAIIKEKVNGDARARNHKQTPAYGTLYGTGDFVFIPSLEQKVADNKAEIAKLEAELKALDAAAEAAKLTTSQAEITRQQNVANAARRAIEGKMKAEQLKKDQLAAEEQRRQEEAAERQKLQTLKGEDDKRLAALKASADARRLSAATQQAGNFPTIESAVAEIKRLNAKINSIEVGYEKELTQTRQQVQLRYAAQLKIVSDAKRDEFETPAEFNAKQNQQRAELNRQRDAELARLNAGELATAETAPLRNSIQQLAEREYTVGVEAIAADLGAYDAVAQQFSVSLKSKTHGILLAMNGSIPLSVAEAKAFKQQWVAGLVRAEVKAKPGNQQLDIALVNDADNTRLTIFGSAFMTSARAEATAAAAAAAEKLTGVMLAIPGRRYEMGKTEVTQAQWQAVMGSNPSKLKGDSLPVEQVSWDDIQEFLTKLNAKTGKQYRLPTEAEWDYACYGGNNTKYTYCNRGYMEINSREWYKYNEGVPYPVGQNQANGYGLYDMSGNVWEWMEDCGSKCDWRVLRGGSWNRGLLRESITEFSFGTGGNNQIWLGRSIVDAATRIDYIGFRLARTLP